MKALLGAFNQEKVLVGAFSVIVKNFADGSFAPLVLFIHHLIHINSDSPLVCVCRDLISVLAVTFLPPLVMNIINQASVYIKADNKHDLVITVNITIMMVLASIYLSVSSSLPSTPNIKPVEWFLLLNLMYPFFVILASVLVQVIFVFMIYKIFFFIFSQRQEAEIANYQSNKGSFEDKEKERAQKMKLKMLQLVASMINPLIYLTLLLFFIIIVSANS